MIDIVQPFWKPVGWTSFDVVKKVRTHTKVRKVGHAGTLDPFAEGILIICLDRATKRVDSLMSYEKEYRAFIQLGTATDTLDPTGTVTEVKEVPVLEKTIIRSTLQQFTGEIEQQPPMFSALRFGGKRLYEWARQGRVFPREPRRVHIHTLDLLDWTPPDSLEISVVCGRGTYIRSLADDIARRLGTVGHVAQLIRTRIGEYRREDAIEMNNLTAWKPITA